MCNHENGNKGLIASELLGQPKHAKGLELCIILLWVLSEGLNVWERGMIQTLLHSPVSCKKRMWLLMRNTDGTAIIGKTTNLMGVQASFSQDETSHRKEFVSFVLGQWGFAVFSGRLGFLQGLVRFWVGFSEKSCTVAELWGLPADLMLRTVMTDVWVFVASSISKAVGW